MTTIDVEQYKEQGANITVSSTVIFNSTVNKWLDDNIGDCGVDWAWTYTWVETESTMMPGAFNKTCRTVLNIKDHRKALLFEVRWGEKCL